MKSKLIFIFSIFTLSCTSTNRFEKVVSNYDEHLVYVLPIDVEKKLNNYLQLQNESSGFYFELSQNRDLFSLLCVPITKKNPQVYGFLNLKNSNRVLLVDTKLYPLVFESDLIFGTLLDNMQSLELSKRISIYNEKEYSILRGSRSIVENTLLIKFNKNGLLFD